MSYNLFKMKKCLTFCLSRIDPLPKMDILVPVSSCSLFREFPFGPNNFPTKLNCRSGRNCHGKLRFLIFLKQAKKHWLLEDENDENSP